MTILEIFEKVNLVIPIEQRVFFNYFEDTVNELQSLYGDFVFITDISEEKPQSNESSFTSVDSMGNRYENGVLVETVTAEDNTSDSEISAKEYSPPKSLTEDNVVLPLYHNAIVDNILYFATQGEAYKGEFMRKSKDAYLKYWTDDAKGRRKRRMRW